MYKLNKILPITILLQKCDKGNYCIHKFTYQGIQSVQNKNTDRKTDYCRFKCGM